METTYQIMILIGRTLLMIATVLVNVLNAVLSTGQTTNRNRKARNVTSPNYRRVRGYSQTKGHWKHEGRMGGRTQERYRHGR